MNFKNLCFAFFLCLVFGQSFASDFKEEAKKFVGTYTLKSTEAGDCYEKIFITSNKKSHAPTANIKVRAEGRHLDLLFFSDFNEGPEKFSKNGQSKYDGAVCRETVLDNSGVFNYESEVTSGLSKILGCWLASSKKVKSSIQLTSISEGRASSIEVTGEVFEITYKSGEVGAEAKKNNFSCTYVRAANS